MDKFNQYNSNRAILKKKKKGQPQQQSSCNSFHKEVTLKTICSGVLLPFMETVFCSLLIASRYCQLTRLRKCCPSPGVDGIGKELMEQRGFTFPLTANNGSWFTEGKSQNVFHSPVTRKNGRVSDGLCSHSQGEKQQQDELQTFLFKDRTGQWQNVEM